MEWIRVVDGTILCWKSRDIVFLHLDTTFFACAISSPPGPSLRLEVEL